MNPSTPKRYYGDDSRVNPGVDLALVKRQLHAVYTHWVRRNYHRRDFAEAVEHACHIALATYQLEGSPVLVGEAPEVTPYPLAQYRAGPAPAAASRLYDELDALNPEISLKELDEVLAPLFIQWVMEGWLPRDFTQAAKDCAVVILYDHQLCAAMGGMGGGKTAFEFLTQPYKD